MQSKISVIVPVYNVDFFLERCIQSIINQSYRNLQIILVDDGSTDKSGEICDVYSGKDDRIVVVHQPNKGLVTARKVGLELADGEYIGFVDGDDYVEEDMYSELLREIQKSDVDFVHSGFYLNNKLIADFSYEVIDLENNRYDMYIEALRMDKIWPSIWSKLFKASVIKTVYAKVPDNASYGEDLVCLCELIGSAKNMLLLNKAYYHYVVRENSISNIKANDILEKEIVLYSIIKNVIGKYVLLRNLEDELQRYLQTHVIIGLEKSIPQILWIPKYSMANPEVTRNKKVVIYGAGEVGKSFYSEISKYQDCRIVGWIDSKVNSLSDRIYICNIDRIADLQYDIVVLAVNDEKTSKEIRRQLMESGVEENKIYWEKPLRNL